MDQISNRVVLETERHRIRGTIAMPREGYRSRLSEFLNAVEREFIAVTDATIEVLDGSRQPEVHPFVSVARSHVVLAVPEPAGSDER